MKTVKKTTEQDLVQLYYGEIKNNKRLSLEQEKELSERVLKGDKQAREKLISANLRLVVKIASLYRKSKAPMEDLIQEGNIGLIKAAEKYDYRKKAKFSTYASLWIKQYIVRYLNSKQQMIKLPYRKEEQLRLLKQSVNTLSASLMREPTVAELSEETGLSSYEIQKVLNFENLVTSMNVEQEDSTFVQQEIKDDTYDPQKEFVNNSLKQDLMKLMDNLKEREKKILLYRFAFHGGNKHSLQNIGQEMGISAETVRQTEQRALNKIRVNADSLREYCYV